MEVLLERIKKVHPSAYPLIFIFILPFHKEISVLSNLLSFLIMLCISLKGLVLFYSMIILCNDDLLGSKSLKHALFYNFTECGVVPLKSGCLHYNTKCEIATRVTLRESSSSTFSNSRISFFFSIFFFPGMQKPFNMFVLKCLGKFNFWTVLHCKSFWFWRRWNSVLCLIVNSHPKYNAQKEA